MVGFFYYTVSVIYLTVLFVYPDGLEWLKSKVRDKLCTDCSSRQEEDQKEYTRLREELQCLEREQLRKEIKSTGENEIQDGYLRDKIFHAIDYAINRHDWYEHQRTVVFNISTTICAVVIAGLASVASAKIIEPNDEVISVVMCVLVSSCVTICRNIYLFNEELDAHRPYRSISDIRFWYFKYNLSETSVSNPRERVFGVSEQRKLFFKRALRNFDNVFSLREDLEQIFILQILQKHKSESLKNMRVVMRYFVYYLSFVLVSFSLYSFYF